MCTRERFGITVEVILFESDGHIKTGKIAKLVIIVKIRSVVIDVIVIHWLNFGTQQRAHVPHAFCSNEARRQ